MARPDLFARIQALQAAQPRVSRRPNVGRRDGVQVEVDGRALLDFCSNDHLGLAQHFSVVNALQDAAARDGVGAGVALQIGGRHAVHDTLEREVADWLGYPRARLFNGRLAANLAVQQALLGEDEDVCVQDTLNHASLIDATRLAGARLRRYPHLDTEGAMRQLRAHADGVALLATDGIFDADGGAAPLRSLSLVARMQQALLFVDDAHGVGVVGEHGRGSVAAAGLGVDDVPLQLVSLENALGGSGALVLGAETLLDYMQDNAQRQPTGLPPAQAAAALEAVRLARRDQWRREKLAEQVALFRGCARRHGLALMASETPIQPVLCGSSSTALAMAQSLQQAGCLVGTVLPPGAPEDGARLRITLSALHSAEQVQALVDAIALARDRVQPPLAASANA